VYTKHFGLEQEPFSIAPDPRYLYLSERHREALAHLIYGLRGAGGVVLLTGEIGAGKTTVCRCFLDQVPAHCHVAYIFNPKLTVLELLGTICDEFGIALDTLGSGGTVKEHVDAINGYLLRSHAQGRNSVLIIDEAQNLSADVLEQLRLLTNLETTERKLLQIILIGQPELREMLAQPQLEQLAQRVTARYHLEALDERETMQYMRHRMGVAGRRESLPFEKEARERIHALSRGVPRRINLLCDRALLGAYARNTQRVTVEMVDKAALEVFGPTAKKPVARDAWRERIPWLVGGAVAGALVIGLIGGVRPRSADGPLPSATAPTTAASTGAPSPSPSQSPLATPSPAPVTAPSAAPPRAIGSPPAAPSAPVSVTATPSSVAMGPPPSVSASAAGVATPREREAARTTTPELPTTPLRPIRDEKQAWRMLALMSDITLPEGEPCVAAGKERMSCERRRDGTVTLLRGLRGPALLTLRDAAGAVSFAVYTGVSDAQTIMLRGDGGVRVRVELRWLASQWRGEYALFKSVSSAASS
jgi:general secretion pathway protein A